MVTRHCIHTDYSMKQWRVVAFLKTAINDGNLRKLSSEALTRLGLDGILGDGLFNVLADMSLVRSTARTLLIENRQLLL
jgi:hypothetical protein